MSSSTPQFRDLLHAANLRHETDGFTSPPKEGVLRIFSSLKIRWLRPGLNPRTWVLKASMLPLDHRSRYIYISSSYLLRVRCVPWSLVLKVELVPPSLLRSSNVPSSFWSVFQCLSWQSISVHPLYVL